jgi:hypothetical protein
MFDDLEHVLAGGPAGAAARDLFEIDNAKSLYPQELSATFIPTSDWWRLFSARNQVVLGSRGSGKTAVLKMLAHQYLSKHRHARARAIVASNSFVGLHIAMNLDWIGALRDKPWLTEADGERLFQWRLNVASCASLLPSVSSLISAMVPDDDARTYREYQLVKRLAPFWGAPPSAVSFADLRHHLRMLVFQRLKLLTEDRILRTNRSGMVGTEFDTPLFDPLRWSIEETDDLLDLHPTTTWIVGVDEAELLSASQQKILNTVLRASDGHISFKIGTLPYGHYTLATNAAQTLDVGHDFEYVRIDRDPIHDRGQPLSPHFANEIYSRLRDASGPREYPAVTLVAMLGESPLLDPDPTAWSDPVETERILRAHLTRASADRAISLYYARPTAFRNQYGRKVRGLVRLREGVQAEKGNRSLDLYSGAALVVRCSDGNPRRLIRLLKRLAVRAQQTSGPTAAHLAPHLQSEILSDFGASELRVGAAETRLGPRVLKLIDSIGAYARNSTHAELVATDVVSSIRVDDAVGDDDLAAIRKACDLGLLFASVNPSNPDQWPARSGYYHLAYVLAPYYRLLPRRGHARSLATILETTASGQVSQLHLFGFGNE